MNRRCIVIANGQGRADTGVHASTEENHRLGFSVYRSHHGPIQIADFRLQIETLGPVGNLKSAIAPKLPSAPGPRSAYESVTQAGPKRCLPTSIPPAAADPAGIWMHLAHPRHPLQTLARKGPRSPELPSTAAP